MSFSMRWPGVVCSADIIYLGKLDKTTEPCSPEPWNHVFFREIIPKWPQDSAEWNMGMDQYLLIPFLGGWTSIYQLFWCSLGTRVLTHPHIIIYPVLWINKPQTAVSLGGYHKKVSDDDYWRSTTLINKPWFSKIRGWHYMIYPVVASNVTNVAGKSSMNGGLSFATFD